MNRKYNIVVRNRSLLILLLLFFVRTVTSQDSLYTDKPASNWHEAYPLGNGRIGAMVYGGIFNERIQTNEDTFWAGGPRTLQKDGCYKDIEKVRQLIAADSTSVAENIINSRILGPYYYSYLPFVDILIGFEQESKEVTEYSRVLDLSKGVLVVSYKLGGKTYRREYFISYPDQVLMVKLTCDDKDMDFDVSLNSKLKHHSYVSGNTIYVNGQAPEQCWPHYERNKEVLYSDTCGMRFQARLMIHECDGVVRENENTLHIENAGTVVMAYVAATSFNGFDKNPVTDGKDEELYCRDYQNSIREKKYEQIYSSHIKDFSSLYRRVELVLGDDDKSIIPLDERIAGYEDGKDPSLTALYFQFGRYLLISSSRPGTQPANLQGIWCDDMQAAWGCNYTLNCNLEINYWPVEVVNLSECHLPLMEMINEITVDGAKTAKVLYNSSGWTVHHNLDLWRTTWPVGKSGQWGIYQAAPAWLCQHIWMHYEFTGDKGFLRKYFPVIEGAAEFYLHTLQKTKNGLLVTSPSVSFENIYLKPDGTKGWVCQGPSSDMQMIRTLFDNVLKGEQILGTDSPIGRMIENVYSSLPPLMISPRTGELQEWYDDWSNYDNSNGQVPHGWGAIVTDMITIRKTPEFANAFRKTLDERKPMYMSNGGSWIGAFAAGWWARFEEADSLQKTIDRHFKNALYPNLTSKFHNYFQIDGNLGFTNAIAEMLLQSHSGEINILPALPSKYSDGHVKGLKARGNHEVDIYWKDYRPYKIEIKSKCGGDITLRYKEKVRKYKIPADGRMVFDGELKKIL